MPNLSNYPPGVSGNEPQINPGDEDEILFEHNPCGEVFDDVHLAALHGLECPEGTGDNDDWALTLRELAF
jgi:hypothetical protein